MTDQRPDETHPPATQVAPVSDDALDRTIAHLLAVDPSPKFLATVRARLHAEPAPPAWRFRWLPAAGTLALAALILAVVVSRPAPSVTDAPTERSSTATRADTVAQPSVVTPTRTPEVVTSAPAPPPVAEPAVEPELTVSPEPLPTPGDVAVAPMPTPPPPVFAVLTRGPPRFSRVVISGGEATTLRWLFAQVRDQQLTVPRRLHRAGPSPASTRPWRSRFRGYSSN